MVGTNLVIAVVALTMALFPFFGWETPGSLIKHRQTKQEFVKAVSSENLSSINSARDNVVTGSPASAYVEVVSRLLEAQRSQYDTSPPAKVSVSQSGSGVRLCAKTCARFDDFTFESSSGRVEDFNLDGTPIAKMTWLDVGSKFDFDVRVQVTAMQFNSKTERVILAVTVQDQGEPARVTAYKLIDAHGGEWRDPSVAPPASRLNSWQTVTNYLEFSSIKHPEWVGVLVRRHGRGRIVWVGLA